MDPKIFKAYDIRGEYPSQIDEDAVYKIAQAYAQFVKPKVVVLGKDVRESSPQLWESAAKGFTDAGVDILDIGTISTDMMYFAVPHFKADGGLIISASHNPREYNGIKMTREEGIPISGDTGLKDIKALVEKGEKIEVEKKGKIEKVDVMDAYTEHCLSFIDTKKIKPLKIVANGNFGMAGTVLDKLIAKGSLPIEVVKLNSEPDGSFPKGRPDPLVPENRGETSELVKSNNAEFAVAWDADADRCFFFDNKGKFVDGYYIVALLASIMLRGHQGEKIVIEPRMVFATKKAIEEAGGKWIINKVGHTFIKERMRKEDAIFAGENSAHLYFRDNYYCDNGMIPFLLILQEVSENGALDELVKKWTDAVKISGEINYTVDDPKAVIEKIAEKYNDADQDRTDGLSIEIDDARFNVRPSNTEPLLRLNVEARSVGRMEEIRNELQSFIEKYVK